VPLQQVDPSESVLVLPSVYLQTAPGGILSNSSLHVNQSVTHGQIQRTSTNLEHQLVDALQSLRAEARDEATPAPSPRPILDTMSRLKQLEGRLRSLAEQETSNHKVQKTVDDPDDLLEDLSFIMATSTSTAPEAVTIVDFLDREWRHQLGTENATVVGMMGVRDNNIHDEQELAFALCFNILLCGLVLLVWSFLRWAYPMVYAYRSLDADAALQHNADGATEAPGGIFGWIRQIRGLTDEQVLEQGGLDCLMLATYYRLCRNIMFWSGGACILVLCPMHAYYSRDKPGLDMLSRISMEALIAEPATTDPVPYWIHAVMVWFVVITTLQQVYRQHCLYLDLRFAWLCKLQKPQSTTLLIENIPNDLRSDSALHAYFVKLFGSDAIERAYLVRRTQILRHLIGARDAAADGLREAEASWANENNDPARRPIAHAQGELCCCAGEGEDAILLYSRRLKLFQARVDMARKGVEDGVSLMDTTTGGVCSQAGFVTFTSLRACRLASREQYKPDAAVLMPSAPPAPEDVDYESLGQDPIIQGSQRWLFGVCLFFIFLAWLPLVASVGQLVNFSEIENHIPFVRRVTNDRPSLSILMQAIVSTSLLRLVMSLMPCALMWGIRRFLAPKSGNDAQLRLQGVYFMFLVIFVLLITAISSSVWHTIVALINSPTLVLPMLATSLPGKSHWYTEFLLLGWLADITELIRITNLMTFLGFKWLLGDREAKRRAEPQDQDFYGMGARMARIALHMTIALAFCTCFPLISIVGWIFFSIGSCTHVYLIIFAEDKVADYGGEFWVEGLKYILWALVLFVLIMSGVLHEHSPWSWKPTVFALTSILSIFIYWRLLNNLVWQSLPFETIAEVDDRHLSERPALGGYVQSECMTEKNPAATRTGDDRLQGLRSGSSPPPPDSSSSADNPPSNSLGASRSGESAPQRYSRSSGGLPTQGDAESPGAKAG